MISEGQHLEVSCKKCGGEVAFTLRSKKPIENGADVEPSVKEKEDNEAEKKKAKSDGNSTSEQDQLPKTRVGRGIYRGDGKREMIEESEWEAESRGDKSFIITVDKLDPYPWRRSNKDQIQVLSTALQKIFRSAIKYSPGMGLASSPLTLDEPYMPLYFYWDLLSKTAEAEIEETDKEVWKCFEQFHAKWIQPDHVSIGELLNQGVIQYTHAWALFRPGEIVYTLDEYGEPCLHVIVASAYREPEYTMSDLDRFSSRRFHRLCVDMWSISWDPSTEMFQRLTTTRSLRLFTGSCPIASLPFYPLSYHKGGDAKAIEELRSSLEKRGLAWKALVSEPPCCRTYTGPAKLVRGSDSEYLNERIVIDGTKPVVKERDRGYHYSNPYSDRGIVGGAGAVEYEVPVVSAGTSDEYGHFDNFPGLQKFDPLQAQLSPSSVCGYSLKAGKWFIVRVAKLQDVEWATTAIDHLVLDDSTKDLLVGLVQQHRKNRDRVMSDVIASKGKGLVVVLHGSPGVGKTLTAETIAEYTRKPLYPINIGELTAEDWMVERLREIFARAARWDAVLLLDEADVLLEKRSFEDLHRNGVVSVFLRMLEYYEGIMFLTTNRLETMDLAFQSRIHIAIKYDALTPTVRRRLWENFIARIDDGEAEGKKQLLENLDDMAEWDLNGRQIRNVITIAESWALGTARRRGALRYKHVEDVASQTLNFQDFFDDASKERKAQIGGINNRQFQEIGKRNAYSPRSFR